MTNQEAIEIVQKIFDPLAKELGLQGPSVSVSNFSISLGYFGHPIGLEVEVDIRDFFIYALIFPGNKSQAPKGYYDVNNKRQTLYIQEAIKELDLGPDNFTKQMRKLGGRPENCEALAILLASLVKMYWADVAARHQEIFN